MAPTLEDLLAIPPDQVTPQHVHMLGLAPDPIIPPVAPAAPPIAKMTPPASATEPAVKPMTPPASPGITMHYHEAPEPKPKEPKEDKEKPAENATGFRTGAAMQPVEPTSRAEVLSTLTPPASAPPATPLALSPAPAPSPAGIAPMRPPAIQQPTTPSALPSAVMPSAPSPTGIDTSLLNAPKRSLESFQSREAEPRNLSLNTTAGGLGIIDRPGTSGEQADILARQRDEAAHPWGSPENHPGFLGKLAHYAARIGNIAGNIVAPATMANIPGTDLNKKRQENQAFERQAGAETRETAADLAKAKEQFEENQTRVAQQKADTGDRRVDELQQRIENDEKKNLGAHEIALRRLGLKPDLQNPTGPPIPITRDEMSEDEKTLLDYKAAQAGAANAKAELDRIKGDPDSPQNRAALERVKIMAQNAGTAAAKVGIDKKKFLADYYGTDEQGNPIPGADTDEKGRPIGTRVSNANKPTSQSRAMAEMAKTVETQIPGVISQVQKLAGSLGPAKGRWNELMVNKGGTDFPEFAGLDQDLDLLSSAIVRTHFGARGGQDYRIALRKNFGEAQSPEDLIARIQHAETWIKGYAHMNDRKTHAETGGPANPEMGATRTNRRTQEEQTWDGKAWQTTKPAAQVQQ